MGGTGKTPLVIWLANFLQQQGFTPAIVSRGYGGKALSYPCEVKATSRASEVGDEPLLIFSQTQCPVIIDPKRVNAVDYLLKNYYCNIIISDDGLQHYALARDIEIAVIDGDRRFGNGFCFPAGPLREPVARLKEVDFIVANGKGNEGEFVMQLEPHCLINLVTGEKIFPADFRQKHVHAVAGIGNPERFFQSLRNFNFTVIPHALPDHHPYKADDINFNDSLPVIMTEKDAVKCGQFANDRQWYMAVTVVIDADFGNQLLGRIRG